MSKYTDTLLKLSKSLVAQYDTIFEHNGNRGDSRESAVYKYITKIMPKAYGFAKGEFFDNTGFNSGEVDLIIYDNLYSPVFGDESDKLLCPIESTYGTIEVKSKLTTGEFKDCVRKINKYAGMERPSAKENQIYLTPDQAITGGAGIQLGKSLNKPIFGVFAYDNAIDLDRLLMDASACKHISYVVVPNKFIYLGQLGFEIDGKKISNFILETERSVAIWIILLQMHLSATRLVGLNKAELMQAVTANQTIRFYSLIE